MPGCRVVMAEWAEWAGWGCNRQIDGTGGLGPPVPSPSKAWQPIDL